MSSIIIHKTFQRRFRILLCAIFSLCILIFSTTARGEEQRKVLFISSYAEDFMTVPEQINGIQSVFQGTSVSLSIEYMDTKKYDSEEYQDIFYRMLKYKLEQTSPYDVILVGDDAALQFTIDYQSELFQDIPIVFLCINDISRAEAAVAAGNMTGITEVGDPLNKTIEIAHKFYPQATKVAAILDDTLTGQGDRRQFFDEEKNFPDLEFIDLNVSDYTFDEFGNLLADIEEDTILVYMCMFTDKTGETKDITKAVTFISNYAKIPVFRHSIGGVGEGLIGGKMVSYVDSGAIAAKMAMDIINGKSVKDIPMIPVSPHQYFFDYRLLEKYHIDKKLIPEDAVIVNRKLSLIESNRELFFVTLVGFVCIGFIATFLLVDNIYRRKNAKKLKILNSKLNQAYDDLSSSEEELRVQLDTIGSQVDEIKLLNQKYQNSIFSIDGAVWELEIKSQTLTISDEIQNITPRFEKRKGTVEEILGQIFEEEAIWNFNREVEEYLCGETKRINIDIPYITTSGKEKWVIFRGKSVSDAAGNPYMIHGILMDITKMKSEERYIAFIAEHDSLTSLPNRLVFVKRLEEALETLERGSVFSLDIDNFKGINDTLGHVYGDSILVAIANRLQSLADENFFISRHTGDEFLILLTGVDSDSVIYEYASRILNLFHDPITFNNIENYISCSIGISNFPGDSCDAEQLIMNADTAMYRVKKESKNDFMFYFEGLNEELKERIALEATLRTAVKNKDMELYYQPQVDVHTRKIKGFEALLRFNGVDESPFRMITLAEELGLIVPIGRWVTLEAIKQISKWRDMQFPPKVVSINFSSGQLRDDTYIDFLRETLRQYGVSGKCLEIEITESIFLARTEKTLNFLQDLKELGVHLALDDFGTGYSSLNYLTYIPVDVVKLDKSLIDRFMDMKDVKFMESLISLVHGLNMTVIAEGVELEEQFELLKNTSCDVVQGYLFSRPVNIEKINEIYDKIFEVKKN